LSSKLEIQHAEPDVKATCLTLLCAVAVTVSADDPLYLNGFDVSNATIPVAEILPGGPPRDGIPALDEPVFLAARDAGFLSPTDRVIGIVRAGEARAYPIAILNWHEIVNDRIGAEAVAVTYCPLCGTGMIFSAGDDLSFGVSGLLYNSDVLMYDRETESLWSQLKMEAVTGSRRGQTLDLLPASHTTWSDWVARHPDTRVLSDRTGFDRDYSLDPYAEYRQSSHLYFPVSGDDGRYHPKEQVIGVTLGGESFAWPFVELSRSTGAVKDRIAGQVVEVRFDSAARTGAVFTQAGEEIPSTIAYWFAWISFYPESRVYRAP
jgi:hypothetical protein